MKKLGKLNKFEIKPSKEQMALLKIIESLSVSQNNENIKDVIEADNNAIKLYLEMGFSKKDAFNAFCKVFKEKNSTKRFKTIKKFIKDYEINKNKQ